MIVFDKVWLNGEIRNSSEASPSIASVNVNLGTSVFDGMVAYWNRDHYYLHELEAHLSRFKIGANAMDLPFHWPVDSLAAGLERLLEEAPQQTYYVRPFAYRRLPQLQITGDIGKPVDVCIFITPIPRDIDTPLKCQISPIQRISSSAFPKHTKVSGAYVNSYLARRRAQQDGFDDGIMLDSKGLLAEASAANLFLIFGNEIVTTAPNPDIFPGITREVVKRIAQNTNVNCNDRDLQPEDIHKADGAFLCSTLMEIRRIVEIDNKSYEREDTTVFDKILKTFREVTHQ